VKRTLAVCVVISAVCASICPAQPRGKPAPTHRNVGYGPDERNVVDVWLACVATNGGQTTMDFDWWQQWIPGYEKPHRVSTLLAGKTSDWERAQAVLGLSTS
jgi:hypothetical protein